MRILPEHKPSADEEFYLKLLGIMSRPARIARTLPHILNAAFYVAVLSFCGFLASQVYDRAQPPVTFVRAWADPAKVPAGTPVHQWVSVVRHKRCAYQVTWSVTDARNMVSYFGPVFQVAPGPAGPDVQPPFGVEFATPPVMAPGPATLRVTLRGDCPGNYLDDWFPVEIQVPEVRFEAVEAAHDTSPGAKP